VRVRPDFFPLSPDEFFQEEDNSRDARAFRLPHRSVPKREFLTNLTQLSQLSGVGYTGPPGYI
jgi:hypothetical protein